jgi:hypothetical protein
MKAIAVLLVAVAACGGSNGSSGADAAGGLRRIGAFTVSSAMFNDAASGGATVVKLASYARACDLIASGGQAPGSKYLLLGLNQQAAGSQPVMSPGTYPVGSGGATNTYQVEVHQIDAACDDTILVIGNAGSVTIQSVTSSAMTGSFDLSMFHYVDDSLNEIPTADTLQGTFQAAACAELFNTERCL